MRITPIRPYRNYIQDRRAKDMYGKLASGKKIMRASDNAAGLAIANKLKVQSTSHDVYSSNIRTGINLANVKDGALSSMQDNMQRINELNIRAMNGIYSDSDRAIMQNEINQNLQGMQYTAKTTKFNEIPLMDESASDIHIASNSAGGTDIPMENTTTSALGMGSFNVMGYGSNSTSATQNSQQLSDAMNMLSSYRSKTGAVVNGMEHAYNYNQQASENLVAARSRIEDLDMAEGITEHKRNQVLERYRLQLLNRQMKEQQMNFINLLA